MLPDVTLSAPNFIIFLQVILILALKMPIQSKLREHTTMPDNNEEVQREVEERTGTRLCIWQIEVVCMVLDGKDMITAATGSGKSFPYWIPLLYIKYRIIILVTPLKLLNIPVYHSVQLQGHDSNHVPQLYGMYFIPHYSM